MTCFEVSVNGEPPLIAGDSGASVVSMIASLVPKRQELALSLSGLAENEGGVVEELSWLHRTLKSGDTVVLKVVEVTRATEPASRRQQDSDLVESGRRQYFEQLKRHYEGGES